MQRTTRPQEHDEFTGHAIRLTTVGGIPVKPPCMSALRHRTRAPTLHVPIPDLALGLTERGHTCAASLLAITVAPLYLSSGSFGDYYFDELVK